MAAAGPPLRLRPLDLSDLLDEIFQVYRARFALFASLSILLVIPSLVISYFAGQFDQFGFLLSAVGRLGSPPGAVPTGNQFVPLLIYPVQLVLGPFTIGVLVRAALDVVFGQPTGVRIAARAVLQRYWALLGYFVVYSIVGFSLLIPPLFAWLFVRMIATVPAMIAEGRGPIAGIERSWQLVQGRYWRTLLVVFLIWLLQGAISYGLVPLFGLAAALIPGIDATLRGGLVLVGVTVANALTAPIHAIGTVLLYVDFRVRKEAMDLDQMARSAALAAA